MKTNLMWPANAEVSRQQRRGHLLLLVVWSIVTGIVVLSLQNLITGHSADWVGLGIWVVLSVSFNYWRVTRRRE